MVAWILFFFSPSQKAVRDKEYKAFQIKLERLEKLCRALQMERNELSEQVEVLKEQVNVNAVNVDLVAPLIRPCTALASQDELKSSSSKAPGVYLDAELEGVNETKHSSKTLSTWSLLDTDSVH